MQRLILVLSLLFFLGTSCKKSRPSGVLKEEDFVNLMTEVHILDGYIVSLPVDSARKVIDPLYLEILAKYDLDTASFSKNLDYYMADSKLTGKAYEGIVNKLQAEEMDFARQDSLKNVKYQDSLASAFRDQRRVELLNNMIMNAKADSMEMSPAEYTRRMYELSGIQYMWNRNLYTGFNEKPISPGPAPLPMPGGAVPTEVIVEDTVKKEPQVDTPVRPRDPRFKPVTRPKKSMVTPLKLE